MVSESEHEENDDNVVSSDNGSESESLSQNGGKGGGKKGKKGKKGKPAMRRARNAPPAHTWAADAQHIAASPIETYLGNGAVSYSYDYTCHIVRCLLRDANMQGVFDEANGDTMCWEEARRLLNGETLVYLLETQTDGMGRQKAIPITLGICLESPTQNSITWTFLTFSCEVNVKLNLYGEVLFFGTSQRPLTITPRTHKITRTKKNTHTHTGWGIAKSWHGKIFI
jgi:hypothetical protein